MTLLNLLQVCEKGVFNRRRCTMCNYSPKNLETISVHYEDGIDLEQDLLPRFNQEEKRDLLASSFET